MQEAKAFGRDVFSTRIVFITDLKFWMLVDKITFPTKSTVCFTITTYQVYPVASQKEDPFFVTSLDEDIERVMTVLNELLDVAGGPVPDLSLIHI